MELLFVGLISLVLTSAEGSSLWSLSHLSAKDVDFDVEHDYDSVRVRAFFKDLSLNGKTSPVRFFLYRTLHHGVELRVNDNTTLLEAGFEPNDGLKVLIHGFANSANSSFSMHMTKAYAKQKKHNVLLVDWSVLCVPPFYSSAVDSILQVGAATADLIEWLMSRGLSLSLTHILGHSVGAHIAGVVGRTIAGRGVGVVGRITGLDPAKPMFEREPSLRLSSEDAEFVDCIHTCGGFLGLSDANCHVDFYPNGGTSPQPGCQFDFFGICSHQRAYKYYAESITNAQAFKAIKCSTIEGYSPANCSIMSETEMGEYLDVRTRGIFYSATASKSPFSLWNPRTQVGILQRFSWYFL